MSIGGVLFGIGGVLFVMACILCHAPRPCRESVFKNIFGRKKQSRYNKIDDEYTVRRSRDILNEKEILELDRVLRNI